jgi:xanthine/CO dehydrogenase XdhC/CoxF family maturation factor
VGDRLLLDGSGAVAASWSSAGGSARLAATLAARSSALADRRTLRRAFRVAGMRVDAVWEAIQPAPRLLVCGAGTDAAPVAAWAAELGWQVRVVDHRPAFARRERFPLADVVVAAAPGAAATAFDGEVDAVVIMSHHFERDAEYLRAALASTASYVGVLGARARTKRLLEELVARGTILDAAAHARLYAPIGLDIGADTPEEIALAIVSELTAVQRRRAAGSLRGRRTPIHGLGSRALEAGSGRCRGGGSIVQNVRRGSCSK